MVEVNRVSPTRFKGRNRYNTFTYPQSGFGLKSLLTLSNGEQIEPPKYFRKSEKKLAWEQVQLSRKKLGSKNRQKQRLEVAKVHRKIRNQRKDFAHKTSRWLINTYDHIVFEDLQIQNILEGITFPQW